MTQERTPARAIGKVSNGAAPGGYTASDLTVLEGLEPVRKRPGMYIGSTDSKGLMHCVWEIIDNAVDEALAGYCTHIEVVVGEGWVQVGDNGRGIPVDTEPSTGLSGVELVMTKLHAGAKFGQGSYTATGGLHGVGASVVNALSARLDVEVHREGAVWGMSFRQGTPGSFAGTGPDATFTPGAGLQVTGKLKRGAPTGTRVCFWPDSTIFLASAAIDVEQLCRRARQTAYLVPGLTLTVHDQRGQAEEEASIHQFCFTGGIAAFCQALAPDTAISDVVSIQGQASFTETVPMLDAAGHLVPTAVERELGVDIALQWGTGYDTTVRSFVNVVATPAGGTHVAGFERALTRSLNDALRSLRMLKAGEAAIIKDDALEGLTAVVTVRLAEPQFEGQTKEVLGTAAVTGLVAGLVEQQLKAYLTSTKRAEKASARAIAEKVLSATRTRIAARAHKEAQRRKNALETSALPAKLSDCRSGDTDRSELFIVEGDSALGTAKLARDAQFQALLPIRGKILNTQRASVADMLKNTECAAIIQVIGAGTGRTFDLEAARYGRVIILADADSDGAHIRCLLLTLFYRHMRPLLEAGRVFAAVPPLHRIEVLASGKTPAEVIYTYSDAEMASTVAALERKGRRVKDPIQRYKGLGEMDADQLAETTMSPRGRTLRRLTAADAAAAEEVFELLMGNEVAPRREFIVSGAQELDRERIDA